MNQQATNEYFDEAVASPMMRVYDQQIAPRIRESYAGIGAFSSRMATEQSRALGDLSSQLGAQRAVLALNDRNMQMQMNENAMNRQLQAVPLAQGQSMMPWQRAGMQSQLLDPYQQRADMRTLAAYQEFLRTRPESSPWLGAALSYMGQSHIAGYQPNSPIGGAIGGGLGIGLLAASNPATAKFALPLGLIGALGGAFVR